jgi:uncharacterized coiled-coil protein SlyX
MTETEFTTFIQIYQKRLNDAITQSIALEAKVIGQNREISELNEQISKLTKTSSRKKVDEEYS